MEKKDFRDNLQRISETFNKELITLSEVCGFLGCTPKQIRADKNFPLKKIGGRYYTSVVSLAKWLS